VNLLTALRVRRGDRVAFTGAGGKTSAIFQLARQVLGPVLVTTTTHMAETQLAAADLILRIDPSEWPALPDDLDSNKVIAVCGHPDTQGRVTGPGADQFELILDLQTRLNATLLVEGDGARGLALKAPAGHEPVVPEFVNLAVVVAGLSAIGSLLGPASVHRPEIFADLSGTVIGEPIGSDEVVRFLTHEEGGLKGLPPGARRVILLNQSDDPKRTAIAGSMAVSLLSKYSSVIIASLQEQIIQAVKERIGAVVLAAGESRRMGRPKQTLEWRGEPFVRWVAAAALQAGCDPVLVVLGANAEEVEQAVSGLNVRCVHNSDWAGGQSTSLRTGLNALPENCGGCLFLLADQPQIPTTLLQRLIEGHARNLAPITAPLLDGRRGNPVLFDRVTFPDLDQLMGDAGGRQIFGRYPIDWVPWHDPTALADIDTPEDYLRMQEEI